MTVGLSCSELPVGRQSGHCKGFQFSSSSSEFLEGFLESSSGRIDGLPTAYFFESDSASFKFKEWTWINEWSHGNVSHLYWLMRVNKGDGREWNLGWQSHSKCQPPGPPPQLTWIILLKRLRIRTGCNPPCAGSEIPARSDTLAQRIEGKGSFFLLISEFNTSRVLNFGQAPRQTKIPWSWLTLVRIQTATCCTTILPLNSDIYCTNRLQE